MASVPCYEYYLLISTHVFYHKIQGLRKKVVKPELCLKSSLIADRRDLNKPDNRVG